MARDYTTTELVLNLKRRGKIPSNQNLLLDADFIKILSDEMIDEVVPTIMSVREDHFVTHKDTTIVSGTTEYGIPSRAIGGKLKDVTIVDSQGMVVEDLPLLTYTDVSGYTPMDFIKKFGFYLKGDSIELFPNESGWIGQSVRMHYFRRPNQLVPTTSSGKILDINTGTNEVTLDNAPTSWTTSLLYDVIAGKPPFKSRADDVTVTNIAGFVLTLSSLPTGMVVGDYIAEAEESPIPQIPYDGFGWLAQRGALKAIESIAQPSELQAHVAMADRMRDKFMTKITPRVDDAPKKITSRSGIFRVTRRLTWPR